MIGAQVGSRHSQHQRDVSSGARGNTPSACFVFLQGVTQCGRVESPSRPATSVRPMSIPCKRESAYFEWRSADQWRAARDLPPGGVHLQTGEVWRSTGPFATNSSSSGAESSKVAREDPPRNDSATSSKIDSTLARLRPTCGRLPTRLTHRSDLGIVFSRKPTSATSF